MKNVVKYRSIMLHDGLIVTVGSCEDDTGNGEPRPSGFMNITSKSYALTLTELFRQTTCIQDVIEFGHNKVVVSLLMTDNTNDRPYSKFMCFDISMKGDIGLTFNDITSQIGLPIVGSHCRFVKKSSINYIAPTTKLILMSFDACQHVCSVDTFDSYEDTNSGYLLDGKFLLSDVHAVDVNFRVQTECTEALVEFIDTINNDRVRDVIKIHPNLRSITNWVINYDTLIFNYTAYNSDLKAIEYFTFIQPYSIVNNCLIKADAGYSI